MKNLLLFLLFAFSISCTESPVSPAQKSDYQIIVPARYKDEIQKTVEENPGLEFRLKEFKIFSNGVFFSTSISADYGSEGNLFAFQINDRNLDSLVNRSKKALSSLHSLFTKKPNTVKLCDLPPISEGMENFARYFIEAYLPKLDSLKDECLIKTLQPVYDQYLEELLAYLVSRKDLDACYVLTRVAKHDELENLQTIIFALSEIGGNESLSYLHAIAYGHPVGQIRVIALEALAEIQSKKKN